MQRVVIIASRSTQAALAHLLAGTDFEVVATAHPDQEAPATLQRAQPDLVLIDLEHGALLPPMLDTVQAHAPRLPIVLLADKADRVHLVPAIARGVRGFLLRENVPTDLLGALRGVVDGGVVIDPYMARHLVACVTRGVHVAGPYGLSRAEEEVVAQLTSQLTNQQIGQRIGIAESTVKTHLRHAFRKLGVRDRADAVSFVAECGLA